ncbi:MAG: hypothetical protein AB7F86_00785 [Bdellovibrionales bacterium]
MEKLFLILPIHFYGKKVAQKNSDGNPAPEYERARSKGNVQNPDSPILLGPVILVLAEARG